MRYGIAFQYKHTRHNDQTKVTGKSITSVFVCVLGTVKVLSSSYCILKYLINYSQPKLSYCAKEHYMLLLSSNHMPCIHP